MIRKIFALEAIITGLVVIAVAGIGYSLVLLRQAKDAKVSPKYKDAVAGPAPFAGEIKEILQPLRYSGMEMLERENARIDFDFRNKKWILYNVHEFDANGKLLLENGKYGICGELAAYTYEKIRPLFSDRYNIWFVKCAQSGYFLGPESSHIVLFIKDIDNGYTYVLDPSFRRYGNLAEFEDYMFFENIDTLSFVKNRENFVTLPVNSSMPLLIRKDYLLSFVVEDNNGLYDEDNFVFAIASTKKYNFAGRYIFAMRMNGGKLQRMENQAIINPVLKNGEYKKLCNSVERLFYEAKKEKEEMAP